MSIFICFDFATLCYHDYFLSKTIKPQYAHNVVLTSARRRFNIMDVVWTSKRCRVRTGTFVYRSYCKQVAIISGKS